MRKSRRCTCCTCSAEFWGYGQCQYGIFQWSRGYWFPSREPYDCNLPYGMR